MTYNDLSTGQQELYNSLVNDAQIYKTWLEENNVDSFLQEMSLIKSDINKRNNSVCFGKNVLRFAKQIKYSDTSQYDETIKDLENKIKEYDSNS